MARRVPLECRLAALERLHLSGRGVVGTGQFNPLRDEADSSEAERAEVWGEAIKRLTHIELLVFDSLVDLRQAYPTLSGAEFFNRMSPLQHSFEQEWTRLVRSVIRDRLEGIDTGEPDERREEIRRRAIEQIEEQPPPWWQWQ